MIKTKLEKRIALGIIFGFLILCLLPGTLGAKTERIRPIDDWIYGNDPDSWDPTNVALWHVITWTGNPFGGWCGYGGYDSNGNPLAIHLDWIALNDEVEYSGFVLEREMPDGSLKVKVNLHVKGIYVEVYNIKPEFYQPLWMYFEDLAFVGTMDFTFQFEFVIDDEPGAELPPIILVWMGYKNAHDFTFKFNGMGTGNRVQPGWLPPELPDRIPYWWFLPPEQTPADPPILMEEAIVKVNQIEMAIPHSPNFWWGWVWPIEKIQIH